MKSAVETLSPTRVRLTVEVPFAELGPSLDQTYRDIAKQITIPGFRKGKVPPPIIDQRVGRQTVLEQAVNDAIPDLYRNALQENEVEPLGRPEVDVSDVTDGTDLTFTVEVDVVPEITLPDYKGVRASVPDAEVTDDGIDGELQSLRERFGSLQAVERPAQDDDYLTLDLSVSHDGEPVEDGQATGYSYQVGSGSLFEELDEVVRGANAGDEKNFTTTPSSGPHADQELRVDVTVQAVKEQQLPELDDEFAQLASEFDTLDELRADVRERLAQRSRVTQAGEAREKVLESLLETIDVPLPDGFVEQEVEARRNAIRQQLSQMGMSEEQYLETEGQTEEELVEDLRNRAAESTKATFVLDAIAKTEEFAVSEDEFGQHMVMRAQQSGVDPNQFIQHVLQHGHLPEYIGELRRNKALQFVVEHAEVTDESGNPVELKRLRPDGSYTPEEAEGDEPAESDSDSDSAAEPAAESEAKSDD